MPKEIDAGLTRSRHDLKMIEAKSAFYLECFGDYLAEREGYKEHDGMDAIFYYLTQKPSHDPC